MGTRIENICWPARFWLKWLVIFAGAAFCGAIVGALLHLRKPVPAPPPQIQAQLRVFISYAGGPWKIAAAKVYFAAARQEIRADQMIRAYSYEAAARTQAAGVPIDFMVQPLDNRGDAEGDPVHFRVVWPTQRGAEVPLRISRPYPDPSLQTQR